MSHYRLNIKKYVCIGYWFILLKINMASFTSVHELYYYTFNYTFHLHILNNLFFVYDIDSAKISAVVITLSKSTFNYQENKKHVIGTIWVVDVK